MGNQVREFGLFIDGEWTPVAGPLVDVVDSTTEQVFARVSSASEPDIDRAVETAKSAQPRWATLPAPERAAALRRLANHLESRRVEIADAIVRETGMGVRLADRIQVGLPIGSFRAAADLIERPEPPEVVGNSVVISEPVGVVATITPWNYPLHQAAAKIAFALAAGCAVVHKPSSLAPVDSLLLADLARSAGLPPGVLNVVTGDGAMVGGHLASHVDVDMISFTGSGPAGASVAARAATTAKRVALELGGKSPALVSESCDDDRIALAAKDTVAKCFLNSGQTCSALTRLIVPRSKLDLVEETVRAAVTRLPVGDPFDASTRLGPLASAAQRERVLDYIHLGAAEGARLVVGGPETPASLTVGYYVTPTVFSDVTTSMRVANEEIFGPVLCIIPCESDEEGLQIANSTRFGLAGAVWADTDTHAIRLARSVLAGQVDVNGAPYNPAAPFGGYRQSGIGREFGIHGLREFQEVKSIQLPDGFDPSTVELTEDVA